MQQLNKMKTFFLPSILLSVILLAGCQTTSDSSSSSGAAAAMETGDSSKPTLFIEYHENQPRMRAERYNTINNEMDRFIYLERNFEKVLGEELSEYNLDFQLFPVRAPEGADVLELTFLSFDSPSPIEVELRLWVILKQGDKSKDFGITRVRAVPQRPMTSGSIERDLDSIYTDAAKQILNKISGELK